VLYSESHFALPALLIQQQRTAVIHDTDGAFEGRRLMSTAVCVSSAMQIGSANAPPPLHGSPT
jgi:hypothetical protein